MRRLGPERRKVGVLHMRKLYFNALKVIGISLIASYGSAYTVVTLSTSAPASLEKAFINSTTSQFSGTLSTNPFFAGTYQLKLDGLNPNYNPPVQQKALLDSLVSISSYNYVYGWGDGESYQQYVDATQAQSFIVQCSTPSVFVDKTAFTTPWDSQTCAATAWAMYQSIYQLHLSTPTVVPGGWQ